MLPIPADALLSTTVMATDTRSMSETQAVATTRDMATQLMPLLVNSKPDLWQNSMGGLLFKKTDSALRGHVMAEMSTLMAVTGVQRAVFLPANPSKGRIIANGIYYIKDVRDQQQSLRPIHKTDFSFDPEFPATTSVMRERFPEAEGLGIIMPDATSMEDIRRVVAQYDDGHTLFAGAADLFAVLMAARGGGTRTPSAGQKRTLTLSPARTLILCGSTQSTSLGLDIPLSAMPKEVYDGSTDLSSWLADAQGKYAAAGSLILHMTYNHRTGKTAAEHLRQQMATVACLLMRERMPQHLVVEGGATAFATLSLMGWKQFGIVAQPVPGVVTLQGCDTPLVTLKPGSYPWPDTFFSDC